jgi:hypothetical protein
MSVDRTTCLGLGWVISHDKYEEMRDAADNKWGAIEDYFHYIDCYREDSDVFVGELFAPVGEGEWINLIEAAQKLQAEVDEYDFGAKFCKILVDVCGQDLGPESPWTEAQVYLLHRLH